MKNERIIELPNEEEKKQMAKDYFDSLYITQKAYLYPTKGFLAGMNKMISMIYPQQVTNDSQQPYTTVSKLIIVTEANYNPNFGDDRMCVCGHPYYRHFDTYDDMSPIGCKYCECYKFKEK